MAENLAEKIHDPTVYRRQQAREQGRVARSRELESASVVLLGVAALLWLGRDTAECLARLGTQMWGGNAWLAADPEFAQTLWSGVTGQLARAFLPILGQIVLGATFVQLLETGWLFLPGRALPDWSRIDPAAGLARLWSLDKLLGLAFSMAKIAVVTAVVGWCLYVERAAILQLAGLDTPQIARYLCELLLGTSLKTGGCLLVLALVDYGFQWWRLEQSLKLSAAELREEQRSLQANPEIVARRRTMQRERTVQRERAVQHEAANVRDAGDGDGQAGRAIPARIPPPQ